MYPLVDDVEALKTHVIRYLARHGPDKGMAAFQKSFKPSAVLFLLGQKSGMEGLHDEPSVILNKRSNRVRQPGDLCFPGGSLSARLDRYLAHLLRLPFLPAGRWPYWRRWRRRHPQQARDLAVLLATSLRESFEEMGLNPFDVTFLGPLPPQRLRLFRRVIYPMVGWVGRQKRFFPNWEVDKVIHIPLRCLLNPAHYARYRIRVRSGISKEFQHGVEDFPCFCYRHDDQMELLWGVTYRIVMVFLDLAFGFKPPPCAALPVLSGILEKDYFTGNTSL